MLLKSPLLISCVYGMVLTAVVQAQVPRVPNGPPTKTPPKPSIEKTGPSTYRIGKLNVDTARKEIVAPGYVNEVMVLEFVANTRDGFKGYESALTIDTNAITFNTALLLIGLDPANARVPTEHFDPRPPTGDPVEVSVEWIANGESKRVPIEQLLFDRRTETTIPPSPWVYTGSTFIDLGTHREFMAEMDGVLIGFVHSPAPLIENTGAGAVNGYGAVVLNPNLGLKPGQAVTMIVRALPRQK
jgi:hypothetical protein